MIRRILVLLAALLLLAGCGGGSDPAVVADPTPSPTVSPVKESSSAVPVAETPAAFIRRWAKAEVGMQNSGDATEYNLITAGCSSCAKFAEQVAGYYAAGGFVRFGGQTVNSVRTLARNGNRVVVRIGIDAEPTTYKRSAEAPTETFKGGPTVYKMTIEQGEVSWTVVSYTRLAA